MAKEKQLVTVNGYGVILADTVEALSTCLYALGEYLLIDVKNNGKTLVYAATCQKTRIATLSDHNYDPDGEPDMKWNCQYLR